MVNEKKVAIVGCGFVGSSSAFALMQSGLFSEMVLIDVDKNRAEGEALDIAHGMTFAEPMKIYAGDYSDVADAAMIVVTAGAAQKPGETRLDLVNKNVNIFKSIIPEIKKSGFDGILLIVSNPVDVLTYAAIKMSGLPEGHVIGLRAPCSTLAVCSRCLVPTSRLTRAMSRPMSWASTATRVCRLVQRSGCWRSAEHLLRASRSSGARGCREAYRRGRQELRLHHHREEARHLLRRRHGRQAHLHRCHAR